MNWYWWVGIVLLGIPLVAWIAAFIVATIAIHQDRQR